MTVSTLTNKKAYTGNGITRDWGFTFPVLTETDMSVYVTDLTTEVTTLLVANYEVDLLNSLVTYPTVASGLPLLTSNDKITLVREVSITQTTDYTNAGAFPSDTIETSEDRAIMISQQIQEQLDRIDQKDIGTGLKDIEDVKTITFSDSTVQTSAGVGSASAVYADDGTEVLDGGTNGTDATFTGDVTGNSDTATALETGRTISIIGDIAYTSGSFDGTGNVTGTGEIQSDVVGANELGVTAGTATASKALVVDASKNIDLAGGVLTGDVTGAINGVTDGSAAAAGEVGEVAEYTATPGATTGSTTLGVYTDCLTGCTLTAGNWVINVNAQIIIDGAVGAATGAEGVVAMLAVTDNSNNIVEAHWDGFADTAYPYSATMISFQIPVLKITSTTTYKLRFCAIANSGSPSVSGAVQCLSSAGTPVYFRAIRV